MVIDSPQNVASYAPTPTQPISNIQQYLVLKDIQENSKTDFRYILEDIGIAQHHLSFILDYFKLERILRETKSGTAHKFTEEGISLYNILQSHFEPAEHKGSLTTDGVGQLPSEQSVMPKIDPKGHYTIANIVEMTNLSSDDVHEAIELGILETDSVYADKFRRDLLIVGSSIINYLRENQGDDSPLQSSYDLEETLQHPIKADPKALEPLMYEEDSPEVSDYNANVDLLPDTLEEVAEAESQTLPDTEPSVSKTAQPKGGKKRVTGSDKSTIASSSDDLLAMYLLNASPSINPQPNIVQSGVEAYLKTCLRCYGDLIVKKEQGVEYLNCFQCGHDYYHPLSSNEQTITALSKEMKNPGAGKRISHGGRHFKKTFDGTNDQEWLEKNAEVIELLNEGAPIEVISMTKSISEASVKNVRTRLNDLKRD